MTPQRAPEGAPGRHRAPGSADGYTRGPRGPQGVLAVPAAPPLAPLPAADAPADGKPVVCGFCRTQSPVSEMHVIGQEHGRELYRCADIDPCVKRWAGYLEARPAPDAPRREVAAIGELDEDAEQHMAAFNAACDEEEARATRRVPQVPAAAPAAPAPAKNSSEEKSPEPAAADEPAPVAEVLQPAPQDNPATD